MCVIVHKPAGQIIEVKDLTHMWQSNPHGAGLAYFDKDNRVVVEKGIMKLKQLQNALAELDNKEVVVHFRWATHGVINPYQTHPFAVSRRKTNAKIYGDSKVTFKSVLFHNGVIDGYGDDKFSDTLHFVTKTLAEIPKLQTRIDVLRLIDYSKFTLMQNGKVHLVGDFLSYKGLQCSNLRFVPVRKKPSKQKTINLGVKVSHSYDDAELTWEEDILYPVVTSKRTIDEIFVIEEDEAFDMYEVQFMDGEIVAYDRYEIEAIFGKEIHHLIEQCKNLDALELN